MVLVLANFGDPKHAHARASMPVVRVDLPLRPPADCPAGDLVQLAVEAAADLGRYLVANRDKNPLWTFSVPGHPALAVALTAVIEGLEGAEPRVAFPRDVNGSPVILLDDLVETADLDLSGVMLHETICGTNPDASPLPPPPVKYGTAFLCLGRTDVPATGSQALRIDMPLARPDSGALQLLNIVRVAAQDNRDSMLKILQARDVVVGLPDHPALAVTAVALLKGYLRGKPPLRVAWPAARGDAAAYDVDGTIDTAAARELGAKIRKQLEL